MNQTRNIFLPLMMLIGLVLIFLATTYNRISDRYVDFGEDAPVINELHPTVESKKNQLLEEAAGINIDVVITDDVRSIEEQDALYAEGRTTSGDIVTNTRGGESYHNYGMAIDYALRLENGEISWDTEYDGNNNGESDWIEVADLAKELGFDWGGDWSNFPDYPHLQIDFGLSISQLQDGIRPAPGYPKESI